MVWRTASVSSERVDDFVKQLGVPRLIAQLLARMEFGEGVDVKDFMNPMLKHLDDPNNLTNLSTAVDRLKQAMSANETILVIGDYDVDGVTSTSLLVHALNRFGVFPNYVIPRRTNEGYGLSCAVIDRAFESASPKLVITVDCGTNSADEVRYLNEKGADVIIVDHHRQTSEESANAILVNPHVHDGEHEPWKNLCAVGLVFKLIHGLIKNLREEGDATAFKVNLKDYLDLVAMGTVADLVPLVGENRILASKGLKSLSNTRRRGLHALFQISGMQMGAPVTPLDISFKLGPRINASGRLADAEKSVKLLLSKDTGECMKMAQELDGMNKDRQSIEREIVKEADQFIEDHLQDHEGYVLFNQKWHSGVVGIVAGRLSRLHNKPAIVLGQEGELAKGSGRSIPGVSLVEVLKECDHLLESWGGHPMASGVALLPENVPAFTEAFNQAVSHVLEGEVVDPKLEIAAEVNVSDIDNNFMDTLEMLHPFGMGNPEPVFNITRARMSREPSVFGNTHFRFNLQNGMGGSLGGVAWNKADNMPPANQNIDFAVKLSWNSYNGRRSIQMELQDWRLS